MELVGYEDDETGSPLTASLLAYIGFRQWVVHKEMQNTKVYNISENIPKEKNFQKTCGNCKHYMGGGDFELCCTQFPELYYEDTPSCNSWEGNVDKLIEIIEMLQGERF